MAINVILSCPFCHQKAEYRDAPPNSTVRCHECSSVFRVPANAYQKHRPGTVLKGEEAPTRGRGKLLVIVLLLLVIAGAGFYLWWTVFRTTEVQADPFEKQAQYKLDTAEGVLDRFGLAWKSGDTDLMLRYCRPGDRAKVAATADPNQREKFQEWMKSVFGHVKVNTFMIRSYKLGADSSREYIVDVEGTDSRTNTPLKGTLMPILAPDTVETENGKRTFWGVDMQTASPKWD